MDDNFWDVYGLQDISTVSLSMGFVDADGNDLSAPTTLTISAPDTSPSFSQDGQEVYNANDIRIITKGIVEDSSEYSNDMYILLLVENNTADTISINEVYDSFSVNGYMMDCIVSTVTVNSGTCAVLDILLWESDLEENSISDVSDISEFEVTFEIEAGNRTIDEAALQVTL